MNMPMPGKVKKPTITKRTPEPENMGAEEIQAFMNRHGFGENEFAEFMGVSPQGVRLWLTGERQFSVTNSRLVRLFIKHPALMKEF